ncbi:MAG: hypothetical protein M2R45_00982 [Verrucomicrobia subdivision 3 bacterium]|nr:hypothetical protein [Limisphaerales bacterium]MCS1414649.1 hypothetical protein [Limisphaerales bacterium]
MHSVLASSILCLISGDLSSSATTHLVADAYAFSALSFSLFHFHRLFAVQDQGKKTCSDFGAGFKNLLLSMSYLNSLLLLLGVGRELANDPKLSTPQPSSC